jgi:hypothetical protein
MSDENSLSLEDHEILNYMFKNLNMSPRDVAKHFNVTIERVHGILMRDLQQVMSD